MSSLLLRCCAAHERTVVAACNLVQIFSFFAQLLLIRPLVVVDLIPSLSITDRQIQHLFRELSRFLSLKLPKRRLFVLLDFNTTEGVRPRVGRAVMGHALAITPVLPEEGLTRVRDAISRMHLLNK